MYTFGRAMLISSSLRKGFQVSDLRDSGELLRFPTNGADNALVPVALDREMRTDIELDLAPGRDKDQNLRP
jgi:hypothetical protein